MSVCVSMLYLRLQWIRFMVKVDTVVWQEPLAILPNLGRNFVKLLYFEDQWWVGIICAIKM